MWGPKSTETNSYIYQQLNFDNSIEKKSFQQIVSGKLDTTCKIMKVNQRPTLKW